MTFRPTNKAWKFCEKHHRHHNYPECWWCLKEERDSLNVRLRAVSDGAASTFSRLQMALHVVDAAIELRGLRVVHRKGGAPLGWEAILRGLMRLDLVTAAWDRMHRESQS